jgi:large conductance mechanosensitive channel
MTYADLTKAGANVFAWGNFVTIIINFVLLAFVIFWMVKAIYKARTKAEEAPAPAATPEDVALLREIRDLLKKP